MIRLFRHTVAHGIETTIDLKPKKLFQLIQFISNRRNRPQSARLRWINFRINSICKWIEKQKKSNHTHEHTHTNHSMRHFEPKIPRFVLLNCISHLLFIYFIKLCRLTQLHQALVHTYTPTHISIRGHQPQSPLSVFHILLLFLFFFHFLTF